MAVNGAMSAARRRVVYGVNAIVQGLLAVALVVGLIWLGGRLKWQADLTSTGINSLSPRTQQLLRNLDQNIRITAVFAEPDQRDEIGQKRRRAIQDLLDLYDAAGGARVSTYLVDPSLQKLRTEKLLKRLRELPAYRDEAKPHEEALTTFPALNDKIAALAGDDSKQAEALLQDNPRLAHDRSFAIVWNNLRLVLREAQDIPEDLADLTTDSEIPRYGQAVKKVRDYLNTAQLTLQDALTWMTGGALSTPDLTPELRTFFEQAPGRYEGVLAEIAELLNATEDLKDVKLEDAYTSLTRWRSGPPVLVESEREARVVPFAEVWPWPTDPSAPVGPDGDTREFAGEAAISSAILQLTQQEKTAVIFTRYGGPSPIRPDFSRMNPMMMRQMPTAPYQRLSGLLEKANFLTEDWNVQQETKPPEVEDAARRIYVVFPPEPPPQPNPMQPSPQAGMTPADRQKILDAISESGMAIFLAGWMPPTSPLPGATRPYEFGEHLKSTWGVEVKSNFVTLAFTPNPQKPGWWVPASREPRLITAPDVVRLTDHPIGEALQAERAAFHFVAPLRILEGDERPEGVTVEVVAEVKPTEDVWACDDMRRLDEQWKRNQGLRRSDADLAAPFPIAVTAVNQEGHKIVVFDSEQFAADALAQATGLQQVGNSLVLGALYPANSDLFINALHWLTGEADRIAVGPRRGELPRLKDLDEEWAARLPWFLVGIWPAVALLAGVGVWLVRRR